MSELHVIGIQGDFFPRQYKDLLEKSVLAVGGKRHLALLEGTSPAQQPITPLAEATAAIGKALSTGDVVVLASGDPLFYGIGKTLFSSLPDAKINIYPALSSLQLACARLRLSWDDAHIVSLHGRPLNCIGSLLMHPKSLLLTDQKNSPDRIAAALINYLKTIDAVEFEESIKLSVAQDMGLASEQIFTGSLSEAATAEFSPLNITCLQLDAAVILSGANAAQTNFGLNEDEINHSRGLITKNEVRAATLHSLRLPASGVFWDIGGGSGSVSVEAARLNPELGVFTIERQPDALHNIRANIKKFGCYNITPVAGEAPEALADLPQPDAVFIGGSGGNLGEIVRLISERMKPGGRCVINGVIAKTIEAAPSHLLKHGFFVSTAEIRVHRENPDGTSTLFNPITIITGTR